MFPVDGHSKPNFSLEIVVDSRMKSSSTKVNPDLAKERGKASFNTAELTYLLHGGRQKTERKRFLGNLRLFAVEF